MAYSLPEGSSQQFSNTLAGSKTITGWALRDRTYMSPLAATAPFSAVRGGRSAGLLEPKDQPRGSLAHWRWKL